MGSGMRRRLEIGAAASVIRGFEVDAGITEDVCDVRDDPTMRPMSEKAKSVPKTTG
jgi:hypothetical protein